MFTELVPMLRKRRLLLTVSSGEGEALRVTIIPQKITDAEDQALTTPLAITGTAEELDRALASQLSEFVSAHLELQSTLATAKAEMDAAAKAAREEARKKTAKSGPPTTAAPAQKPPEPAAPEPPSLFATERQDTSPTQEGAVTT